MLGPHGEAARALLSLVVAVPDSVEGLVVDVALALSASDDPTRPAIAALGRDRALIVLAEEGRTLRRPLLGALGQAPGRPPLTVVVNPRDVDTSMAPSLPGELYWYFDLPGVVIGMTLIGAALRWFYNRYGPRQHGLSPIHLAIYLALLPKILTIEGGIVSAVIGVSKILVVLALLRWAFSRFNVVRRLSAEETVRAAGG